MNLNLQEKVAQVLGWNDFDYAQEMIGSYPVLCGHDPDLQFRTVPQYEEIESHARVMERWAFDHGFSTAYVEALMTLLDCASLTLALHIATPEERCQAFLKAVESEEVQ